MRRAMYVNFPTDLRPSKIATMMSHAGTVMELGVPILFLLTPLGTPPVIAIIAMFMLHSFITSNVPMGAPLEWNFVVVYGGLALFWAHPEISVTTVHAPLMAFLAVMVIAIPLLGNLFPEKISFLLSMRYYAGNWANSVWLFKGDSHKKLAKLTRSSPWVSDQLLKLYDQPTTSAILSKVTAFRLMHLHGRAYPTLIPKAVDHLPDHNWVDGEVVAGHVLGWNFGDGHLHQEALLAAVQAQCGFEEGELRCVFVESQPLGKSTMAYRIVDAKSGVREEGKLEIAELRTRQPWSHSSSA